MKATRLQPDEYGKIFTDPLLVYNKVEFSELNRSKCDDLHYVAVTDGNGRVRFGITLGLRDGELRAPFSAPFGCVEETRPQQLLYYIDAIHALRDYAQTCGCHIRLTLPPDIYSTKSQISKQYLAAMSAGAQMLFTDYTYAMPLSRGMDVARMLSPQSRRKYKASIRAGLECRAYDASDDGALAEAYRVVTINHESRGYPVHMSFDNLRSTIDRMVRGSVYIVTSNGQPIASAINYHHLSGIVQGVYWGNIPEAAELRPMNNIAVSMSMDFARDGFRWFDLGPSSIDGIPDEGLCLFKESLGFSLFAKPTLLI